MHKFVSSFKLARYMFLTFYVAVPSVETPSLNIKSLNGETVVFKCTPSDANLELYWEFETNNVTGIVTTGDILQSKFLSESPLLHQLILPIATVTDTGNYTCIVRGYSSNNIQASQTVSLIVIAGKYLLLHNFAIALVKVIICSLWKC